jgi:hypothetical protein
MRELSWSRDLLIEVLVYHQRINETYCACGWSVLGAFHAEHIADVYESSMAARFDEEDG